MPDDIYGSEDDADVLALAKRMREKENVRRKKRKRPMLGSLDELVSMAPVKKGPRAGGR